jgi:hypothetical protein
MTPGYFFNNCKFAEINFIYAFTTSKQKLTKSPCAVCGIKEAKNISINFRPLTNIMAARQNLQRLSNKESSRILIDSEISDSVYFNQGKKMLTRVESLHGYFGNLEQFRSQSKSDFVRKKVEAIQQKIARIEYDMAKTSCLVKLEMLQTGLMIKMEAVEQLTKRHML